jgi:hypothetical protein
VISALFFIIVGMSIWLKIACKQQNILTYFLKLLGVAVLVALVSWIIIASVGFGAWK